ncbi:MAG: ABC transporter ATP-binding protein [Planctomycetota bacterium]
MQPILSATGLVKTYYKNKIEVPVLRGVDVAITPGKMTAMVGRSGSGKSTLLHLLATLDQPDEGVVEYGGQRIDNATRRRRDAFRNSDIGIIFQFYHLLPELTALENVMVPAMIAGGMWGYLKNRGTIRARATALLRRVGLEHRIDHRPSEMSGGEMQRAAIARALIQQPGILLADEPTGNLDADTGNDILSLLRTLNQHEGLTIFMITHDDEVAASADIVMRMEHGTINRAQPDSNPIAESARPQRRKPTRCAA